MKKAGTIRNGRHFLSSWWAASTYILAVMLSSLNLSACAITTKNLNLEEHVVMVDGVGDLVNPRANIGDPNSGQHILFMPYDKLEHQEYYFARLFSAIENAQLSPDPGNRKRILLFIHGGMNTAQASIERVKHVLKYRQEILKDGTYPIFINWDSSLTSSYLDHLVNLRQGRLAEDWCCGAWKELGGWRHTGAEVAGHVARVVTTPVYFMIDLVRGTIRLPVDIYGVYAEMISTHWRKDRVDGTKENGPWANMNCKDRYRDARVGITPRADRMLCEFSKNKDKDKPDGYPIAQGLDKKSKIETAVQIGRAILTFPVHMASGLLIDTTGTGSWSAMHRRTTIMFNRDEDLWSQDPRIKSSGGIATFMTKLREFLENNGGKGEWEVVVIGHSMGTIVVNEMVRQFGHPLDNDADHRPKDAGPRPLFDKIVYMAAACSLRDYLNTIPHYLEEYGDKDDGSKGPKMYHLVLQDHAEVAEQFLGISLPGSLLVWIDGFFARPDSPLDLVAGRYQNLLRIVHLHDTPHIQPRVSLKAFGSGNRIKGTNPQTHGDFDNFPFWKEEFWGVTDADPFSLRRLRPN